MIRVVFWRIWSALVGLLMIALSLIMQMLVFLIIGMFTVPQFLPQLDPRITILALLLLFNGVSCFEYFRKKRVVKLESTVQALGVIAGANSAHASMAVFLVPRGIDRILTGRELGG